MKESFFAAADLGATSGRVILGALTDGTVRMEPVHRFKTPALAVGQPAAWHWDAARLRAEVAAGVRAAAARAGRLDGVGVDTWGVDYGRLDAAGQLLEDPFNYRDERVNGVPEAFFADFPPERLYAESGLQVMPINTVFQLVAAAGDPGWEQTETVLMLPDLLAGWLSGVHAAELTIASTSGLLDVANRQWSPLILGHLKERYGLDLSRRLPPLTAPGAVLGPLDPAVAPGGPPVVAVAAHDTASAVAAIPAASDRFAYVSCGTWSLVGLELDAPVTTEASRLANFSNELGVFGTVRYLQNVMGLWVLEQTIATFEGRGQPWDRAAVLAAAAQAEPLALVLDMSDDRLRPPGDMPARLAAMAAAAGQPVPDSQAGWARAILDSLALAYRRSIRQAQALAGREAEVVHIVGGGCQNRLLCQLTADAVGLPVVAGPSEGTALGNILVQAQATGRLGDSLADLRRVAAASTATTAYQPGALGLAPERWAEAERRAYGSAAV
ncbi:MAG: rhamnulokinase [Propionibacteriaceae bacterium]|jgi:rhamnulokinase|nr:rhamnulokinase [Propionibacteriaceae bacterium]